jgi:16S rRNA (uracil1498-N3)-methyltransferase
MSLHHLFCLNPCIADESLAVFKLEIDQNDRAHIKALRLQAGEHLAVIDATQDYFEVEIDKIEGDDIWVRIAQHLDVVKSTTPVLLVQGLAKGEKMDTVLRQATELGIAGFFPASMDRSIVRLDQKKTDKRFSRACQIARSASLQSGRTSLPTIEKIQPLRNIIDSWSKEDVVLLFWEEASLGSSVTALFRDSFEVIDDAQRLWIVIGPEGSISSDEVEAMNKSAAQVFVVSLGPTILRTETAGVVASALVLNELRYRSEMGLR